MKTSDRQKMCPSCDGMISVDVVICPYCTADLSASSSKEALKPSQTKNKALQDPVASLYGTSLSSQQSEEKREFKKVEPPRAQEKLEAKEEKGSDGLFPMLAFCLGGALLTLGLLQFFFSENGQLQLEWNASYWYFYCLAAFPLLFFGFKKIAD